MSVIVPLVVSLWMLHPVGVAAPQETAPERIRRAQTALASSLDPSLPAVPLDRWIRQVVGPSARYEWADGACAGPRESETAPVRVCGILLATAADFAVTISVQVGERGEDENADRWIAPRVHDVFIDRGHDSLTVDPLGDLPRRISVPATAWPKRTVMLDKDGVRCSPATPTPGDEVACYVAMSNPGDGAVHARVFVDVLPYAERRSEHVLKIPARARKTLKLMFEWPSEPGATASVGVELNDRSPYRRDGEQGEVTLQPRSAADELLNLMDQAASGELEPILMVRGTLAGPSRTFDVPVDASISRLVISVEHNLGLDVTLFKPGGAPVTAADRDVRMSAARQAQVGRASVSSHSVFTVSSPQTGVWRVELTAAGESSSRSFAVTARGNTKTAFNRFEFVRLERIVHSGYFEIDEANPVAGSAVTGRARIENATTNATFRIIDETGSTLQTLAFRNDDPHSLPDEPVGPVTVPAVPFAVVMEATDASGAPIQRQYPVMFRPQTVSVSFRFDLTQIPSVVAGATKQFRFTVANHGAAPATFRVTARTNRADVREVSPASVSLQPGEAATPSFSVAIPASASRGDFIEVRVAATNVADMALSNSTTIRLEVASPDDVDDDYVKNDVDNCPEFPNGGQEDSDLDGIGDFCDPTPWSPVAVFDFNPKKGPVGTTVTITGKDFDPAPAKTTVTFGHVEAPIVSATASELVVRVPPNAPSFFIVVRTTKGVATSMGPFVVETTAAGSEKK